MNVEIERLVPRFILNDRNGYALAKAIERAFQIAGEAAEKGLKIIQDPDEMPTWRLDELAGELGCLYDYSGTMAQKRYWIENATYLNTVYGTPRAIYSFLEGYFQTVQVEEGWEYGGDPYHFRVTVSGGNYGAEAIKWAQKAIAAVKNARSVLDAVTIDSSSDILVSADMDALYITYPRAGNDRLTNGMDVEDWNTPPSDAAKADTAKADEGVTG